MSARYYWISFIVVMVLSLGISWLRQTRTRKEFFQIVAAVTGGLVLVGVLVAGLAKLLVVLGIAESGFIF